MANPQVENGNKKASSKKIEGGCTLWARKTFESDVFYKKPDKWFKMWFYIVGNVKYNDNSQFERGQGFFKYAWIMEACNAKYGEVDHFLRWAKSARQIATQKARRGVVITVLNYRLYQDIEMYRGETESETSGDLKARQKRVSILKKDKKDKKEDIHSTLRTEIISYLNEKAGKNFSPSTDKTIEIINGRINEGRTLDDFRHVIDVKVFQWSGDANMDKYLRPSTLFNKTKFEEYLNESLRPSKSQKEIDDEIYKQGR